jgi:dTMP kinase
MKGMFLVFEGIDGSGKKTACEYSQEILEGKGMQVAKFQYPDYSSPWGEIIKDFLSGLKELDVSVQFLTYATDIAKDQKKIMELLENGFFVLADRYIISTVAFQCARGFDLEKAIQCVNIFEFIPPDITFYMNIYPEIGKERKKRQKGDLDRHEADTQFLEKVNSTYRILHDRKFLARKWIEIDADKKIPYVRENIRSEIEYLLD